MARGLNSRHSKTEEVGSAAFGRSIGPKLVSGTDSKLWHTLSNKARESDTSTRSKNGLNGLLREKQCGLKVCEGQISLRQAVLASCNGKVEVAMSGNGISNQSEQDPKVAPGVGWLAGDPSRYLPLFIPSHSHFHFWAILLLIHRA